MNQPPTSALLAGLLLAGPALLAGLSGCSSESEGGESGAASVGTAEPAPSSAQPPLYGGRALVHISRLPDRLSSAVDNTNVTRAIQYEVHETLLLRDWQSTQFVPNVASAWHAEDLVVLADDAPAVPGEVEAQILRAAGDSTLDPRRAVYGAVAETSDGYSVVPASPGSDLLAAVELPRASVQRVERGCVLTFELREGVRWQPSLVYEGEDLAQTAGQILDAGDVHFSWQIHQNPGVNCDFKRFRFEAIPDCRVVDAQTVRFFGAGQNAFMLEALADSMTLLPSHIFNLADPDCPDHDAAATLTAQAEHINVNDHNRLWVGVGPYQITTYGSYVEATRFVDESGEPAYFDAATRPGYLDVIRWRAVGGGELALTAMLEGELDFLERLSPSDYFGERTRTEPFAGSFKKGVFYLGDYSFVVWNMHSPKLKDLAVRRAIAHAFDVESYRDDQNQGLGRVMTGPVHPASDGYPEDARAFPHDVDLARAMLEEAGWYDHNGDGVADKGGVELEIELLFPGSSDTFKILARTVQDAARPLGIKLNVTALDYGTMMERVQTRRFEAAGLATFPPLESNPGQLWHSSGGGPDTVGSSNLAGVMDDEVDRLIGLIQREVDRDNRMALWEEFHHHVYRNVQPYLFCLNVPITYAASKKLEGIEHKPILPGYVIREWHYVDPEVPGVRADL